ncbi:constitutive coactivator of peroxisome proliferator-activated receptor gamma isoform X2 [Erinaceus europaeus]|uniref:Constitutive coactivator of peroxisome proliferator-activated receptor gamma isoform X2 n=1 Tax=Erinaceus europaeus TaxID=9365 RepID=A0ABM3YJC6_ERIEU|nr:constitutive coactivator of peroxisome proliferator-activated receptor gamma isoform X2 [Erinaceus europaeus]
MGVRGLQGFVGSACPHICTVADFRELAGRHRSRHPGSTPTLVVDAMCCLRYWYTPESWVCGGQWREYFSALREFVRAFATAGIKLVFFFDGTVEQHKRDVWVKRRLKNNREIARVFHHVKSRREQPGRSMFFIPSGLAIFTRFALKSLGQETLCSLQEADYEVASYGLRHHCLGILGEDTDYLIYNTCPYFSISEFCLETLKTVMLCRDKLCESLDLHLTDLPLLSCLLGNDIVPEGVFESFRYRCLCAYTSVKGNADRKGSVILAVADHIAKVLRLHRGQKRLEDMLPLGPHRALFYKGMASYLLPGQNSPWFFQKPQGVAALDKQVAFVCPDPGSQQEVPASTEPESQQGVLVSTDSAPRQDTATCADLASKQGAPLSSDLESKQEVPTCTDPDSQREMPVSADAGSKQETPMSIDPAAEQDIAACAGPCPKPEVLACADLEPMQGIPACADPASVQNLPAGADPELEPEAPVKQADFMGMDPEVKQQALVADPDILEVCRRPPVPSVCLSGYRRARCWVCPGAGKQVARTRHVRAETYLVYNIMSGGEIECSNTLEDALDQALPSQAFVFRPVRQRVYSLLLGPGADGARTCPAVKEWFVYAGNPLKQPDLVRPLPISIPGGMPSLRSLWLDQGPQVEAQRLDALLACFDLSSAREELQAVEGPFQALCCLLMYLFVQVDTLCLEDLHAFIAQALCLPGKSTVQLEDLEPDYIDSRAVQLGSLLVRGLTTLVLVNGACGSPWLLSDLMPWNVFDGKLFHQKYLQAEKGYSVEALLEQNRSRLSRFQALKSAVCKACAQENRRISSRQPWRSHHTGRWGRQESSSHRTSSGHSRSSTGQSWREQGSRQYESDPRRRHSGSSGWSN